jgi:hypothetical protein
MPNSRVLCYTVRWRPGQKTANRLRYAAWGFLRPFFLGIWLFGIPCALFFVWSTGMEKGLSKFDQGEHSILYWAFTGFFGGGIVGVGTAAYRLMFDPNETDSEA